MNCKSHLCTKGCTWSVWRNDKKIKLNLDEAPLELVCTRCFDEISNEIEMQRILALQAQVEDESATDKSVYV